MHIVIITNNINRIILIYNNIIAFWTKLKLNFNFVHIFLVSLYRTLFIILGRTYLPLVLVHFHYRDTIGIPKG